MPSTIPPNAPSGGPPLNMVIAGWINQLPHEVVLVLGFLIFVVGAVYAIKFFHASVTGKVAYWVGLEPFGWYFVPITILVTPFFCLAQPSDKTLIRWKSAAWVHLFWGPVFFLASLMCLTAGADFMGFPGSRVMNTVLTFGRLDIPPAIVYTPPFGYKFPIIKKARKVVFRFLTQDIKTDPKKSLNNFERMGQNVDKYSNADWDDDDEEVKK